MFQPRSQLALRARWVVPLDGPPIDGGLVAIRDDRIVAVGRGVASSPIDLGDVALLPGLVNAHTHLEFSDLPAPLGRPGRSLAQWIPLVIGYRRREDCDPNVAVAAGLRESARLGVTTIGEIAQPGWSAAAIESMPLSVTAFLELIGLAPERIESLLELAAAHRAGMAGAAGRRRAGVSPHAPYSVHPEVVRRAAGPLAMHLAESREELQLLAAGDGPFRDMLVDFGAWRPERFGNRRPLDYLKLLDERPARREPTLIVHGNYLDNDEIDFIAARPWMSVVYCPRTHAYFGHEPYPLAEMLRRKTLVAIGTDSRASNPDLSVLEELRHVARAYPNVHPKTVLRLGTASGAESLGLLGETGTLAPGKLADLAAVAIPANANDPVAAVLKGSGEVMLTVAAGRTVHDPHGLIGDGERR